MKLSYFFCGILCLVLSSSVFSQRMETLLKQVTKEELKIKEYPKDPMAEAYVIFDKGNVKFVLRDNQLVIQQIRTSKIKILNNEGIKYGEIFIPLYRENDREYEELISVEAYSYNLENGELVMATFDESAVIEEIIDDGLIQKKIIIPNVKAGSVIEYRYVMETPFFVNLQWNFQQGIPVSYSEYSVSMVPFYEYEFILKGASNFDYREVKKEDGIERTIFGIEFYDLTTVVAMRDLPAFWDQSYISSINDYLIKLDFQLSRFYDPNGARIDIMTTWEDLRKDYLLAKNFGDFIKKSQKPAEKILNATLIFTDEKPEEKIQKIVNFAKTTFNWDEEYGKFSTQSPKKLLSKKSGNVADINLFTIGLLRAAGIAANPVIISSRGHGKIEKSYPFDSFFDYVIIQIKLDNGMILTDATEKMIAFDRLPPRCINDEGLVINDAETEEWLSTNSGIPSKTKTMIKMNPDPNKEQLEFQVIHHKTGLDGYLSRQRIGENSDALKWNLMGEGYNAVSDVTIKNYEHLRAPFVIAFQGKVDQETLNEQLVITPFLNYPPDGNYFTLPDRAYPIDFLAPNFESFNSEIIIPEGYEVAYLPETLNIDDILVSINTNYQADQNVIIATGNLNFKLDLYAPKYYQLLKAHVRRAVASFNEKIILQKIE